MRQALPTAAIPTLMERLEASVDENGMRADVAAEFSLVCANGELRSGLNLRLRARDPYENPQKLGEWRDTLCECVASRLNEFGVEFRFRPPAEQGTVCALPSEGFAFLQKKRCTGNLDGSSRPLYYYSASLEGFQLNLAALRNSLARGLDGGISLTLMPARRERREVCAIRSACEVSATEEYLAVFRDMRDAPRHYNYVAMIWGKGAWELLDLLRAGGMEFTVSRLPAEATLPFELALDPWAVNKRLANRTGSGSLGSFACSLTPGELRQLFAEREVPQADDPLSVEVRPDGSKLRELNEMAGSVLGSAVIETGEGTTTMGDIMRALDELNQKLEAIKAPGDYARVADLERMQRALKRDVIAQAQAAMDAQAERISSAVEQINAHTQSQVAPLVQRQAEAFDALFKASMAVSEQLDTLMGKVSKVADQVGFSSELTEQDLRLMGCESEDDLVRQGLPRELLGTLRYAVALYRLAGRMELSDDTDCLPFGFMMGCFYEKLMQRCFLKLYNRDVEAREVLHLKTFDAMDDKRIERYVQHVRFADGSALEAADWIAWFNVLFSMRQLRNRIHAEAGRMRRIDLDCMFHALLSDVADSRANLVAQDYFRVDQDGRRTESVFIPYNYRSDPAWNEGMGLRKWSDQIANYIRNHPEPFQRSVMKFIIACAGAEWR